MAQAAARQDAPPQNALVRHTEHLRIYFSEAAGDHADFHYLWLRHNCDHDRHPQTRERVVCSSELAPSPSPALSSSPW